jgi:uncharacterized phiE125 gp8 family phage protein
MYGLRVITAPTVEPITLDEIRAQTRTDWDAEDDVLQAYAAAARSWVEEVTGRAIMTQTLEMTLDEFPCGEFDLPRAPVQSITSVKYKDMAGAEQTLASSTYLLDESRFVPRLALASGASWPSTDGTAGNVKVRFVAGYTTAPLPLKQAILMLAADWHRNRESPPENAAVDRLIAPYRTALL